MSAPTLVGRHVAFVGGGGAEARICERDTAHSFERGNFKFWYVSQGVTQMTWLDFGGNRIHNVPSRAIFLKNDPNFDTFRALVHLFVEISHHSGSHYVIWYSGDDFKSKTSCKKGKI